MLSVAVLMTLAGCGATPEPLITAAPDPSPTAVAPLPTAVIPPDTAVEPAETVTPVDPGSLSCVPPTTEVMTWLRHSWPYPDFTASDVVMVEVGEGNTPGELWWVVGAKLPESRQVYLTNAPDVSKPSGETWIDLHTWEGVSWTGQRLETAWAARIKALSCLPEQA